MQEIENIVSVPFPVYEGERARSERLLKDERDRHDHERKDERTRWFIVVLVLLFLLFGSNAAWIVYESQFEKQEAIVDVDTGDGDAYVAGIEDITYGESASAGENP